MKQDSHSDIPTQANGSTRFRWARGMGFGSLAGLVAGSLAGVTCLWIVEADNPLRDGGIVGGLIGSLIGAMIGRTEIRKAGASAELSIATHIGVLYGLIPGCLFLLGGIGIVRGRMSGGLVLGAFFACPMVGLFIGGVLDRVYESFLPSRIEKLQEKPANRRLE